MSLCNNTYGVSVVFSIFHLLFLPSLSFYPHYLSTFFGAIFNPDIPSQPRITYCKTGRVEFASSPTNSTTPAQKIDPPPDVVGFSTFTPSTIPVAPLPRGAKFSYNGGTFPLGVQFSYELLTVASAVYLYIYIYIYIYIYMIY